MESYHQVAVKFPGKRSVLLYKSNEKLEVGELVDVPLGKRTSKGCVVESNVSIENEKNITESKIKSIAGKLDQVFSLSKKELELYRWMSRYYHYSLGLLIFDCLPKMLKRPRPVNFVQGSDLDLPFQLTEKQQAIFTDIEDHLSNGFSRHYIHGVTGSGKTAIYLKLIQKEIRKGRSVLFLLPEINLTPQFIKTFSDHLGCAVLEYHSGITDSQKYTTWKYLKEKTEPVVVLGVRSSVFLPIDDLGLVVVDEEHDGSFKQNDRCPYNGRDVAIKKAQISNAPVVLGSATPSVENFRNYKEGKQQDSYFYQLPERISGCFPEVELIDARERKYDDTIWPLCERSIELLKEALSKGEQALVFVNRLGFANFVQCLACGYRFTDPNTGTNLRYFKNKNLLSSAHSDYKVPLPDICPECGNMNLLQKGFGTERIHEVLQKNLEEYNFSRFDRDEIKNFDDLSKKLSHFEKGEIDVFVGTQMLSKGHNFKKVNLVLILGADSGLNFPDFRSMEKTYQMITQVTGRAGRYSKEAKVAIQTLSPDCSLYEYIQSHSFEQFYLDELKIRESVGFPPFSRLAMISLSSRFQDRVIKESQDLVRSLNAIINEQGLDLMALGPSPAMIERKSGQYTWLIMLKGNVVKDLHGILTHIENHFSPSSGVSTKIDVDPTMCL